MSVLSLQKSQNKSTKAMVYILGIGTLVNILTSIPVLMYNRTLTVMALVCYIVMIATIPTLAGWKAFRLVDLDGTFREMILAIYRPGAIFLAVWMGYQLALLGAQCSLEHAPITGADVGGAIVVSMLSFTFGVLIGFTANMLWTSD